MKIIQSFAILMAIINAALLGCHCPGVHEEIVAQDIAYFDLHPEENNYRSIESLKDEPYRPRTLSVD